MVFSTNLGPGSRIQNRPTAAQARFRANWFPLPPAPPLPWGPGPGRGQPSPTGRAGLTADCQLCPAAYLLSCQPATPRQPLGDFRKKSPILPVSLSSAGRWFGWWFGYHCLWRQTQQSPLTPPSSLTEASGSPQVPGTLCTGAFAWLCPSPHGLQATTSELSPGTMADSPGPFQRPFWCHQAYLGVACIGAPLQGGTVPVHCF